MERVRDDRERTPADNDANPEDRRVTLPRMRGWEIAAKYGEKAAERGREGTSKIDGE